MKKRIQRCQLARGQWLDLPGALLSETGFIRLREPPEADVSALLELLREGQYGKPFVVDDGRTLRLHFSLDYVQSEMSAQDPDALQFEYVQQMTAFLLFVPRPRHISIVGLGGGSLTKFCYRQLPQTQVTTIEIDEDVIAFSELFDVPQDDPRLQLVHADAVDYFDRPDAFGGPDRTDVVLIDGCDRNGIAPSLRNEQFYRNVHDRLQRNGMMVMNLVGKSDSIHEHLHLIASVFGGRQIVRRVRSSGNRIVFALKNPMYFPDWKAIQRLARKLQEEHGLDYPDLARKLRRAPQFQSYAG